MNRHVERGSGHECTADIRFLQSLSSPELDDFDRRLAFVRWKDATSRDDAVGKPAFMAQTGGERPARTPARAAAFILCLALPRTEQDALLESLEALFERRVEQFGRNWATFWYWSETVKAIGPLVSRKLSRWGLFAVIGKAVQTYFTTR